LSFELLAFLCAGAKAMAQDGCAGKLAENQGIIYHLGLFKALGRSDSPAEFFVKMVIAI